MSIRSRIRDFTQSIFEPKTPEYNDYKQAQNSIRYNINMYNKYLSDGEHDNERSRWEYALNESKRQEAFIRPNTPEDISYRNKLLNEFTASYKLAADKELDLRFHGTPIYFAEDIIKSGQISSSADRYDGYNKSTDGYGVFSVSDKDSLQRTIGGYTDLTSYQRSMPCGCLFVLTPGDQTTEQQEQSIMNSVNLFKNPERLHSIVTTPENTERVKQWMEEAHMDTNKVHTFEDFVDIVRKESVQLKNQRAFQSFSTLVMQKTKNERNEIAEFKTKVNDYNTATKIYDNPSLTQEYIQKERDNDFPQLRNAQKYLDCYQKYTQDFPPNEFNPIYHTDFNIDEVNYSDTSNRASCFLLSKQHHTVFL